MAVSTLFRLAILTVYSVHGTILFLLEIKVIRSGDVFFRKRGSPKGWHKNSPNCKTPRMVGSFFI